MKIQNKKKFFIVTLLILIILMMPIHTEKYYEEDKIEVSRYTAILYSYTYYHQIIKENPYGSDTHSCKSGTILRILWFTDVDDYGTQLVTQ
ncbi:MAG: hypothetical protein ACI4Q5_10545 [Porcipelethomonas sp.]